MKVLILSYLLLGVFVWWAMNYHRAQTDGQTFSRLHANATLHWPMWKTTIVYLYVSVLAVLFWPFLFMLLMRMESTDDYRARHWFD